MFPCGLYVRPVRVNKKGIQYDMCDISFHTRYLNMCSDLFNALANSSTVWICTDFGTSNFSSSLLHSESSVEHPNPFSILKQSENCSSSSSFEGPRHSTPVTSRNNGHPIKKPSCQKPRKNKFALPVVKLPKCQVKESRPWACYWYFVGNRMNNGDMFPSRFTIFRRDRLTSTHGGGVFQAIRNDLIVT